MVSSRLYHRESGTTVPTPAAWAAWRKMLWSCPCAKSWAQAVE